MTKVIIAGGREFCNSEIFLNFLFTGIPQDLDITEIVSGGARGADAMGERFATQFNIPLKIFPADWKTHPKAAGPIRNRQMAEYADVLVAFWDGKSAGTKNMIDTATELGLTMYTCLYE